jgi:hypothetical protein
VLKSGSQLSKILSKEYDLSKTQTDDMILNWRGVLRKSRDGERAVIASAVADFKNRGFSPEQASDMLLADRYSEDLITECLRDAYAETAVQETKTATAPVAPASYSDVKPVIEHSLKTAGARQFVEGLLASEMPIMRLARKNWDSLFRLATNARNELMSGQHLTPALDMLHKDIEPYIMSAMYDSVVLADKQNARVFRVAKSNTRFKVASAQEEAHVDLESGTSTGRRYTKGNFRMFGIADEHIVRACELAHPYERLKRAIAEA